MRSSLVVTAMLSVSFAAAPPQQKPGKEYTKKKEGFRLRLPPGWREAKGKDAPKNGESGLVAAFESQDKKLGVAIWHISPLPVSAEEFPVLLDAELSKDPSFKKLSEEEATVSGLPARKVVYDEGAHRGWMILLFGQRELWQISLIAIEPQLILPENPGYQQFQQILASFEFLEPVLARLKAAATTTVAKAPDQGFGSGQRYYINDVVGMKILLPPEWQLLEEEKGDATQPLIITLNRPGTLAFVVLAREVLEASHETYKNLFNQHVSQQGEDYRELGEEKVTRSGQDGTRVLISTKENEIRYRNWVQLFSVGNNHYRVAARVPEELFDRYKETFQQMLDSVELLGLANSAEAPAGQGTPTGGSPSQQSQYTRFGSGRVTGGISNEIARLREKVAQNPNDANAHGDLGNALDDSGDSDGAIAEYKAALRLEPNNARAHRNLGAAYLRKGDRETSTAEFREAARLAPDYVLARLSLAENLVHKEDWKGAVREYEAAIQRDRNQAFAFVFGGFGLPAEAQEDFHRAPSEAAAHFCVAVSAVKQKKDRQDVIRELQEASRVAPQFVGPRGVLAELTGK
ncbi:MAG: tetratricopeptide repeat protein [Acidobacteria bacterium]|nr:tetratricopeptide repeat protein [Acidobacteriota bacterium]